MRNEELRIWGGGEGLPILWEAQWFSFGELDEGELLATGDEEGFIAGPVDFESTPEAHFFGGFEVSTNVEGIAEASGFFVIDFGAEEDGVLVLGGHFGEVEAELGAEFGPGGFDEAQVGEVMDDGAGVGVKEHDLFFGLDGVVAGAGHGL